MKGPKLPRRLGLPALAADDLWRDRTYLRLWSSILTSSFANQVMMLALPLTAAVLLQAASGTSRTAPRPRNFVDVRMVVLLLPGSPAVVCPDICCSEPDRERMGGFAEEFPRIASGRRGMELGR